MNKIFEISIQDSNHLKKYITSVCPMELTNILGDKCADLEVFNKFRLPSQLNYNQVNTILFLMKENKSFTINPDVQKLKEKMTLWSFTPKKQTVLDDKKEKEIDRRRIKLNNERDKLKKKGISINNRHNMILFKIKIFNDKNNNKNSREIKHELDYLDDRSERFSNNFFDNMRQTFRSIYGDDYINKRFKDCEDDLVKYDEALNQQNKLFCKLEDKLSEKLKNISCQESKNLIENTDKLLKKTYILFDRRLMLCRMSYDSCDEKIIEEYKKFKNLYDDSRDDNREFFSKLSDNYNLLYSKIKINDQRKSFLSEYAGKLKKIEKTMNEKEKLTDEYEKKLNKALKNKQSENEKGHDLEQ